MLTAELDAEARNALPNKNFAWIDKDGGRHLPIHDAGHVRNALARIDQTKGLSGTAKQRALAKIQAAAKRFGVDASKESTERYGRLLDGTASAQDNLIALREDLVEQTRAMIYLNERGLQRLDVAGGKQAADKPKYGPGGELDWDDGEEPDESEDDTRPGDTKKASKNPPDDGDGDDDDDEDDAAQADEGAPSPGLDVGDVHSPGPMNSDRPKKSKSLRHLVRSVRAHFATGRLLASDQFDRMYRQAIGSQGGMTRKADEDEQIDVHCCNNSCGECQGAGCGCCDDCYIDMGEEDAMAEDDGELRSYTEGSAHFTSKDGEGLRMFVPQLFQFGEWIEYLPKPGKWKSPRYGEIEITKDRNRNFVKNFNDAVYQDHIPVDVEHQTKLGGAYGWINQGGMKMSDDGAVWAYVDWTDRGEQMLKDKRFRYFSPEWYDVWEEPASGKSYEDVAIGGALTTRPFWKPSSLKPIVASEHGIMTVQATKTLNKETESMANDASQSTEATQLIEVQKENERLQKELKSATESAESKATQATENAQAEAKQAREEAKALSERLQVIETADRRRQFTEVAREFSGETDKHVALMEKLDDETRAEYVRMQKASAEQIAKAGFWKAIGSSSAQASEGSAVDEARKAAEQIRGQGNASREKAAAESWTPERYEQYLNENPDAWNSRG